MKPPKKSTIVVSLLIALLLNMLPLSESIAPWRVDFMAIALLAWCMISPRYIGIAICFVLGLLMDVADASVLGQHAFCYTLLAFGASCLRRRFVDFPAWQQAIYAALLMEVAIALTFVARMMSGSATPGYEYFVTPFVATLILYAPVQWILMIPQREKSDK
jgi:rod shape-determining protein MreD